MHAFRSRGTPFRLLCPCLLLAGVAGGWGPAAADEEEEARKQIARQVADAIARRISEGVLEAGAAETAASPRDWSAWGKYSFTNISDDDGGAGEFDVDLHIATAGVDRKVHGSYVGIAATYAASDFDATTMTPAVPAIPPLPPMPAVTTSSDGDADTFAITPYAAIVLSEAFFITLQGSYSHSEAEATAGAVSTDTDADTLAVELDFHAHARVDRWTLRGRVGLGYSTTDVDPTPAGTLDDDTATTVVLFDAEIDYQLNDRWMAFTGAQYNIADPDIGDTEGDTNNTYVRAGVEYLVGAATTLGVGGEVLVDSDIQDLYTVGIGVRSEF